MPISDPTTKNGHKNWPTPVENGVRFSQAFKPVDSKHLRNLCRVNVPLWHDLLDDQIEVNSVTLLGNDVYMVCLADKNDKSKRLRNVLLKLVDSSKRLPGEHGLGNEVYELVGEFGFSPTIVSLFEEGRLEEWVDGFSMDPKSIFNVSVLTSVATLLAKFHKTITSVAPKTWDRTPSLVKKMESWLPLCKKANHDLKLGLDVDAVESYFKEYSQLMDTWIDKYSSPKYRNNDSVNMYFNLFCFNSLNNDDEEVVLAGSTYGYRVIFSHNDLSYTKLVASYEGLRLVDFEKAGYNYAGADVGWFFTSSTLHEDENDPQHKKAKEFTYELKAIFASVYLTESLGVNVLPWRKEVIDPFLDSVELFTLGQVLLWAVRPVVEKTLEEGGEGVACAESTRKRLEVFKKKFQDFKEKHNP